MCAPDERYPDRLGPDEQTVGLLGALSWLRAALLVWANVVVLVDATGDTQLRVAPAVALLALLALWTAVIAGMVRRRSTTLLRPWVSAVDLALAAIVAGADHAVYLGEHPQSFGSAWPMSAAVAAGVLHGARSGAIAGGAIGVAGALGTAWFRDEGLDGRWTATTGTIVLLAVAGGLAGLLSARMRSIELARAHANARERVARTLHDGVLQTLSVIQRRSDDPELVALARSQELDLRRFIGDERARSEPGEDPIPLVPALRALLGELEPRTGVHTTLNVIEAPARCSRAVVEAIRGAVGESVVNADKHGHATAVVVCVDVIDEQLVVTVNDDGRGFEVHSTPEGVGLARSVRARLAEVHGTVDVDAAPGRGCEVTLRCVADSGDAR